MRILVHDYTAFSFPVQLSRELARRGHQVLHLYSDFDPRGGRLEKEPGDADGFQVEPVSIGEQFAKYQYVKRSVQEWRYGKALIERIREFGPEVVFSSNTSVTISRQILTSAHRMGAKYVHWTQDIYSLAAETVLANRFGLLGKAMTHVLRRIEFGVINRADAAIIISADFAAEFEALGIRPRSVHVIPNWMPLDEMKPEPKDNPWSRRHGLDRTLNIMYVGMLGFKHEAGLFIELAKYFAPNPEVRIVAVGTGIVFDRLAEMKAQQKLDNLVLLGWQDYRDIGYVMASGDILISLIASDASRFSVPCKVQSYFSAGRPVLAAIPSNNLAHRLVAENNLGFAADPAAVSTLLEYADRLVESPELREKMAAQGRAYAEEHFDIKSVANRFEDVLRDIG